MSIYPSLLTRSMMRGNLILLMPALGLSIGLYVLTDLFEKLDNFIEAGVSFFTVLTYFTVKIPLIVSQLFPVIFLLAVVIQLCLMSRSRELTALQAGGISLAVPARILIVCGFICSLLQLGFSEVLGVAGERESTRIWAEEVRGRNVSAAVFKDVWFIEGSWVVSLGTLEPNNSGKNFTAYKLNADGKTLHSVVHAAEYEGKTGEWHLHRVKEFYPAQYRQEEKNEVVLPLEQNPATFRLFTKDTPPRQLPIWQLSEVIEKLSAAGSNVEKLCTAWHTKIAYAASLLVMAMLGVALATQIKNIYIATLMSLVGAFIYYAVFTVCTAMGEKGVLPPFIAAWMANIFGMGVAGVRLIPLFFKKRGAVDAG